jgi:aromatic-L-amino-acid/L-tryptophan decarboxylase
MIGAVLEQLLEFVERRATAPATDYEGVAELLEAIRTEAPEHGVPLPDILDLVMAAGEKGEDTAGPGWLAYIPGGGRSCACRLDRRHD